MHPSSSLSGLTEAKPGAYGFLTDATLCIGCKACEVACKHWNQLPAEPSTFTGFSYDNTVDLGATTWRHVAFIEQSAPPPAVATPAGLGNPVSWLMVSDVCKHCVHAGCLEACPTGAIVRTEFGSVYIRQDVCNGCGYCIPACPFGVPALGLADSTAHKCTLCYDRLGAGLEPACAQSCPTDSIQFGLVEELAPRAAARVATLQAQGVAGAHVYGDRATGGTNGIGGLNALFVLTAPPETYNLPANPTLPADKVRPAFVSTALAAIGLALAGVIALRQPR